MSLAHERRPAGAASEAGGPASTVALTVRVRVDISGASAHRGGWVTYEGQREATRRLCDALHAPLGAEVVIATGTLRPMLIGDEALWRELLTRCRVAVECADPFLAREWHDALSEVRA